MLKTTRVIILWLSCFMLVGFLCKEYEIKSDKTREARGVWVTRWEWAREEIVDDSTAQQQRIIDIFDLAKQANLNFILFQVRGNGDALYRSNYEPWSDLLTGTLGKDPGWDPLDFAINHAHERGLELHTWVNTFPAWRGTAPPPNTEPQQVYNARPEWIICGKDGKPMPLSNHYVNLSPGIPEARDYVHHACLDIVKNYDIDGFHFDYIRYPEGSPKLGYSQDSISLKLFNSPLGNPKNLNWEDWQRENINQFVRKFYDEATQLKPWVKISAAVIGKYDYSSWNGYHIVYQDALQWIKDGKMDFIAPMIYWQTDHPTAPFGDITRKWLKEYFHDRYIFPGMSINRLGSRDWPGEEVLKQVSIARDGGNGMVFFSFSGLERAMKKLNNSGGFKHLANLPAMPWKDDTPPMDPFNLKATLLGPENVLLTWESPDTTLEQTDVVRYNIYRSTETPVDIFSAKNLIHITAKPDTFYIDETVNIDQNYFYVVTAMDRVNNESPPSNEVQIMFPAIASTNSELNYQRTQ